MQNKLLEGIKVLDLSRLLPGPLCTLYLADMGVDVLKIEDTDKGDYSRFIPPLQKINSSLFLAINRNKSSITLDLTKEEGKKIFLKLAKSSDVIVESFRPGVVKKLGINYEIIKKENPKIIYCSISGYGQTGPYSKKAGHDLNFCSYSGIIKKSSQKREKPSIPRFQIADIVGGTFNALTGILAALVYQKITGCGQYIDVSMMDGTLANYVTGLSNVNLLSGTTPYYNLYETSDKRYLALAAIELKFWECFCEAINRDDLIPYHIVSGKKGEKIYKELSLIFKTKTLKEWINYFKNIDCCISPVLTVQESINNEQVRARNMVITKKHPIEGNVTQFSLPLKFSNFEFKVRKSAPMHGEHTKEILSSLGYSKKEIKNLKMKKVI